MDDHSEDKLGMYIKVHDLLAAEAVPLNAVSQIATIETQLNGYIADILDDEGTVSADYRGVSTDKKNKRTLLQQITYKVSTAGIAYFLSIGDTASLKKSQYNKSALTNSRDSGLYCKARYLSKVITPVAASLSSYNSGPADVTLLDSRSDTYLDIILAPARKRGDRRTASIHQKNLFHLADALLNNLDIYMNTFEETENKIWNRYQSYRRIDDTGSHGRTLLNVTLNIPPNTILPINTSAFEMKDDVVILFSVPLGSPALKIGFGPDETSIATPLNVNSGTLVAKKATKLSFDGTNVSFNVQNPALAGDPAVFTIKMRS